MLRIATLSNRQNTQLSLAVLTVVVLALHALLLAQGKSSLMMQGNGDLRVFSVRMLPAGISAAPSLAEAPPTESTPPETSSDNAAATPSSSLSPAAQRSTTTAITNSNLGAGPTGSNAGGASAEMLDHSVPLADGYDLDNRPISAGQAQGNLDLTVRVPAPVRLAYKVQVQNRGVPTTETAELSWRHDGKSYEAKLVVSHPRRGARVQTSRGQLSQRGLEPVRYGDKTGSELATHFQRDKGKITFSGNSLEAPLHEGMQDPLSVVMQLAALWSAEPDTYPQGSAIAIDTASTRSVEPWVFLVGALETLSLPGGVVQAMRLVREPVGPYGSRSEIWLAPGLDQMPVRIRTTLANGNVSDLLWSETLKP